MSERYYFDHTATKLISEEVLSYYCDCLREFNYNPAAVHMTGIETDRKLQETLEHLSALLGADKQEVLITSGGTESINTAIKGVAYRPGPKRKVMLTSLGEHSATLNSLDFLTRKAGFTSIFNPLTEAGTIDLDAFEQNLKEQEFDLITLIHVNNETGAVNPVEDIVKLRNRWQPDTPIHLDGVQTLDKIPFNFKESGVDLFSASAHKFGAPKSSGFLLVRNGLRIEPLIHGGGQQGNMRSGTENLPLVMAMTKALELSLAGLDEHTQYVRQLREIFFDRLRENEIDFYVISPENGVPHILSIAFPALRGETLHTALTDEGYEVSLGSACSGHKSRHSSVLKALPLPQGLDRHVLRISFAYTNTEAEARGLADAVSDNIRRFAV